MRASKVIFATALVTAITGTSIAQAAPYWGHYRGHAGPGLIGGLIVGAATIAALPLAIIAGAANPGPPGYYGPPAPPRSYYGPGYYAPSPGYYRRQVRRPYGPPPGYYGYRR